MLWISIPIFNTQFQCNFPDEAYKVIKAVEKKIESAAGTIFYDLNNKIEKVKAMIVAVNDDKQALQKREILPQMPIKT